MLHIKINPMPFPQSKRVKHAAQASPFYRAASSHRHAMLLQPLPGQPPTSLNYAAFVQHNDLVALGCRGQAVRHKDGCPPLQAANDGSKQCGGIALRACKRCRKSLNLCPT